MNFKKMFSVTLAVTMVVVGCMVPSKALWGEYKPYGGFEGKWKRFYGPDRIKTSEYVANSLNPHKNATEVYPLEEGKGVPTVLVNKNNFQDGLTAYNFCKAYNARLLLISPNYANIGLMKGHYKSKQVYLIGSTKEIYSSTENEIKRFMPGAKVTRLGGATPYERNLEALKMTGFKETVVADGRNFPDALSASGLAHRKNMGLMLVKGDSDYTVPKGVNIAYTVGGTSSVSKDMGVRLSGSDRYETGKAVAREATGYDNILFVDGKGFADSISAINLVKPRNSIVIPIKDGRDNSDMKEFLKILPRTEDTGSWDVEKCGYALIVGGYNSISDKTVSKMLYPSAKENL